MEIIRQLTVFKMLPAELSATTGQQPVLPYSFAARAGAFSEKSVDSCRQFWVKRPRRHVHDHQFRPSIRNIAIAGSSLFALALSGLHRCDRCDQLFARDWVNAQGNCRVDVLL
jgi:hypothetical protein